MSDSDHKMILRRMTGRETGDVAETPLTLSRAVRLAFTKSANDTIGLIVTVTAMGEDVHTLDPMLEVLDDNLMLVGLERGGELVGLMALDMQLRAAILEMQAMGKLIAGMAEDRAPTGTDKTMAENLLIRFLDAMPVATLGTEYDGWTDQVELGSKVESCRAAGLVLDDCEYRIMRLDIDLGVADRTGQLIVVLPLAVETFGAPAEPTEQLDWATLFQARVAEAQSELDALLHRFDMPLAQARNLQVGQVVPLRGCSVNSVRLVTAKGREVALAKLGQLGGNRAVRVEAPPQPQMRELGGGAEAALPDLMGGMADDKMGFGGDEGAGLALEGAGEIDFAMDAAPTFAEPETALDTPDMEAGAEPGSDEGFGIAAMDMDALSLED
ncbi:FliM/FliN family flagellar motor switch protein [Yoonia sediminilitoris]|uniref:Type III flagellar switch regulator (C-ring) FliN n=1 Tax=Yoonia sediminilitoris TaxID=1286148 RepID=A0A2T6KQR6_9RHOB|nr:FliM/FliN family flagellar motor C-terminal domain-containing protein [Yoonia sediminilitoris]PUB18892.1 type III flagellar switch regulator (C-ring) FliN [Yoonia sediminilitoris]RCW99060.1 type III flagellar switch regulator (C-ring) FliN [Yoonia sediminilitoris]